MATPKIYDKNGAPMSDKQIEEVYGFIPVTREEFDTVARQVSEIHQFIQGLGQAFNNPMIQAMLPPNLRNMIG
jgi:hypothetical protein